MNHGTLACIDIAKTRRFYEEVLGLDVIQTSPRSLMVRKGGDHVYAVVELPVANLKPDMDMLNHNGFEVDSPEAVNDAYETIKRVKDEWGIKKIMPPRTMHGDHTFYFMDMDGNWWEIVSSHPGGYVADFSNPEADMTGRHDLADWIDIWHREKRLMHMHDPEVRQKAAGRTPGKSE
jgi:catechol 2,3-dioxygenase-like lactoylglutathione lyase family enzyme